MSRKGTNRERQGFEGREWGRSTNKNKIRMKMHYGNPIYKERMKMKGGRKEGGGRKGRMEGRGGEPEREKP